MSRDVVRSVGPDAITSVMSTARVARVLSSRTGERWDRQRALRWLKSHNAAIKLRARGRGGNPEYGTTPALLRTRLQEFMAALEAQDFEDEIARG